MKIIKTFETFDFSKLPKLKRLVLVLNYHENNFLSHKKRTPITLEGALIKRKSRRHRKKHHKRRKTRSSY